MQLASAVAPTGKRFDDPGGMSGTDCRCRGRCDAGDAQAGCVVLEQVLGCKGQPRAVVAAGGISVLITALWL
jgi:hypothetical protein